MPLTLHEKHNWQDTIGPGSSSADIPFAVEGSIVPFEVQALLEAQLPTWVSGMKLQEIRKTHVGAGIWDVTAHYGTIEPIAVNSGRFRFRTGGGSTRITQAKLTGSYQDESPGSETAPDFGDAINVNGDRVEGVDVGVRILEFEISWKFPKGTANMGRAKDLYLLSWTTNKEEWCTFPARTVLFKGVDGSNEAEDGDEMTFAFSASPSVTIPTRFRGGTNPVDVVKDGHDFLWFMYEDGESNNHGIKRPAFAYTHEVYPQSDFAMLGLPIVQWW